MLLYLKQLTIIQIIYGLFPTDCVKRADNIASYWLQALILNQIIIISWQTYRDKLRWNTCCIHASVKSNQDNLMHMCYFLTAKYSDTVEYFFFSLQPHHFLLLLVVQTQRPERIICDGHIQINPLDILFMPLVSLHRLKSDPDIDCFSSVYWTDNVIYFTSCSGF